MKKWIAPSLIITLAAIAFFGQAVYAVAPEDAPPIENPTYTGDAASTVFQNAAQSFPVLQADHNTMLWAVIGIILIIVASAGFLLLRRPSTYTPRSKRLQK